MSERYVKVSRILEILLTLMRQIYILLSRCIGYFAAISLLFAYTNSLADHSTANIPLTGQATQGGLLIGQTTPNSQVTLNNKRIQVSPAGEFVLGFGRDAKAKHWLNITSSDGHQQRQQIRIATREYNIQRINGLASKHVDMPADERAQYRRELAAIKKARQTFQDLPYIFASMQWPVRGEITGVFGSQRILNGKPKRPHYGLDIAAAEGTPIVAPLGGEVVVVIPNGVLIGNTVILDHGHGVTSTLLHLHKIHVTETQWVDAGDLIGEVGQTGRATGPHLHWGMNWFNERLDPALLLPAS